MILLSPQQGGNIKKKGHGFPCPCILMHFAGQDQQDAELAAPLYGLVMLV